MSSIAKISVSFDNKEDYVVALDNIDDVINHYINEFSISSLTEEQLKDFENQYDEKLNNTFPAYTTPFRNIPASEIFKIDENDYIEGLKAYINTKIELIKKEALENDNYEQIIDLSPKIRETIENKERMLNEYELYNNKKKVKFSI